MLRHGSSSLGRLTARLTDTSPDEADRGKEKIFLFLKFERKRMWIGNVDGDGHVEQQRQKDGSAYLVILPLLQLLLLRKADTVESDEDLFSAASAESSSR